LNSEASKVSEGRVNIFTLKSGAHFVEGRMGDQLKDRKLVLDSGTSQSGIDRKSSLLGLFRTEKYEKKRRLKMIDGTYSKALITDYVVTTIRLGTSAPMEVELAVMDLEDDVVLGLDFFVTHGISLDYNDMTLEYKSQENRGRKPGVIGPTEIRKAFVPVERWSSRPQGKKGSIGDVSVPGSTDPFLDAVRRAEEVEEDELEREELEALVPSEFHDSLDLFKRVHYETLPPHRKEHDHQVNLNITDSLRKGRVYPLSYDQDKWLKNWIDESLRKGHIEPSNHSFGSPVFLVPKKGKTDF
jgi:hypothetical protein